MRGNKNFTIFLTVLGLGLLLTLSFFSYISGKKYLQSSAVQIQSEQVISLTYKIQNSIERAESAQRGYLMTQHEPFLKAYREAETSAKSDLKQLRKLVVQDAGQAKIALNLESLVFARLGYLQDNIYLVDQGKHVEAFQRVKSGMGQQTMVWVRETFQEFVKQEAILLSSLTMRVKNDFSIASNLVFTGLLASFVLLSFVTVALRSEVKLRQAAETRAYDSSSMKSQFLANMSHEIRTPLNGVIGMTKVLSDTPLNSEQVGYLGTLRDAAHSLHTLINQILDISKIESGKLVLEETHFELRSLVGSTKSILDYTAKVKGLNLVIDIGSDVPDQFLGDSLRLRQILLNLLNNSIKFSSEGNVTLKISKRTEQDSVTQLFCEVTDQGIGIEKSALRRLFKNFSQADESTTRRFGGTGLGLAITKQLVELMGGEINVESQPGRGSRFYFYINLKIAKYEKREDEAPVQAEILQGHVLVAEDNVTNQQVVGAMLKQMGCTFEFADDGVECMRALTLGSFDLVLMDGQMPKMDGYEATKRIRAGEAGQTHKKIPIIAVTANAIKGDLEKCLSAGMDDYVPKPISQDDLHLKIQKWLLASGRTLDMTTISAMRELQTPDNKCLLDSLIDALNSTAYKTFKDLRSHLARKDFNELSQLAHKFKSTCANVGAVRMRSLSARLEMLQGADDPREIEKLIDALEQEYKIVAQELKRYAAA